MSTYHFKVCLVGTGNTPEQAWQDACEGFALDSGPPPDTEDTWLIKEGSQKS